MKNKAFTLAEVLITLGIIGVVAAITMPALIMSYKHKQLSNQLKASYSILSQGYSKMLADEAVTDFSETSYFSNLEASKYDDTVNGEIFKKYFNAVVFIPYNTQVSEGWPAGNVDRTGEICNKYVGKGSTWWLKGKTKCRGLRQQVYRLTNGSVIRSAFFGNYAAAANEGHIKRVHAEVTVDVNGEKEPNTFGEDVFMFVMAQDGKLYPNAGLDYAYYGAALKSAKYETYYYMQGTKDMCKEGNGVACAGAVMEHNWDIYYK